MGLGTEKRKKNTTFDIEKEFQMQQKSMGFFTVVKFWVETNSQVSIWVIPIVDVPWFVQLQINDPPN